MREISVRVSDDLDFARDGVRHEAAVTLSVGLNGRWAELDLTRENEKLVIDMLDELMTAGHEPDLPPVPAEKRNRFGPNPEKTAFNERLRAWVRATGLKNSSGTGWAYQTNTSQQDYIGQPLVRKYQAFLEETESKRKEQ